MAVKGITTVRNLVSGGVALIAAWSSYSHMVHLVLRYGERPEVAYALPFSVDGMLLVSTIVMADDKRRGHGVRPLARLSFAVGVAASVAANIAAAHPTLGARVIDAWPALALLLVVEMLARPPAPATSAAELTTMPRPEHRDVPAAPVPSANADVPPAKEVPAVPEAPPSSELPAAASVPSAPETAQVEEAAPRTPLPPLPCPAAAGSRQERHLQAVPRANDVQPAEGPPPVHAVHDHPAALAPPAPPIAVPAEHAVTDHTTEVPPEPPDAEPRRPVHPEHPVPAAAERAGTQARPEPHTQQRRSAERKDTKARRPATATRALAQRMMQAEPHLTKTEIAQRLDISTRRLRDVLAS